MRFDEKTFIYALAARPEDARRFATTFKPNWLHTAEFVPILAELFAFTRQHGEAPSIATLHNVFKDKDLEAYNLRYKVALDSITEDIPDRSAQIYTLDKARDTGVVRDFQELNADQTFLSKQAELEGSDVLKVLHKFFTKHGDLSEDRTMDVREAIDHLVDSRGFKPELIRVPCGIHVIDKWTGGGLRTKQLGIIMAPTGDGKCLAKYAKVLMFSGELKEVQDIIVGDKLMGPDSLPRTVLGTTQGYGEMYDVIPVKGEKFTCNGDHVLSLEYTGAHKEITRTDFKGIGKYKRNNRREKGQHINLSVKDYIQQSKTQKHLQKLWRVGVSFPENEVEYDPYFVGLYLGDGTRSAPVITVGDKDTEIEKYLFDWAASTDHLTHTRKQNGAKALRFKSTTRAHGTNEVDTIRCNLMDSNKNRIIPQEYKVASEKNRLRLLAGLMDADGSMNHNCFDFITKYKTLAEDVVFVARSLGFEASHKECKKGIKKTGFIGDYYRINISGDISRIPCKLPRKQATPRTQAKSVLRTGFIVNPVGPGEYYGFELDGDHLFLLKDFTVSHNSSVLLNMAHSMAAEDLKRVWLVTNELSIEEQTERMLSRITGTDVGEIIDDPAVAYQGLDRHWQADLHDRLRLTEVNREVSVDDLEAEMMKWVNLIGWKPNVLVLDFIERMRPCDSGYNRDRVWDWLGAISRDLSRFAKRHNILVWTAAQTNRSGYGRDPKKQDPLSLEMAQGSVKHLQEAAAIIGMRQQEMHDGSVLMEMADLKQRFARRSKKTVYLECDLSKMSITNNVVELEDCEIEDDKKTRAYTPAEKQAQRKEKANRLAKNV